MSEIIDAADAAAADAALAEALAERDGEITPPEAPQSDGSSIQEQFASVNDLIVFERKRTRLSESTLTKMFELTMNYYVWQTQRADNQMQQQQVQGFDPRTLMGNGVGEEEELTGPTGEYLTAVPDLPSEDDTTTTEEV